MLRQVAPRDDLGMIKACLKVLNVKLGRTTRKAQRMRLQVLCGETRRD
jgi:hypothetical protein